MQHKTILRVSPEQEHAWRNILQAQLAEHWLRLYYPEANEPVLDTMKNTEGKAA